MTAPVIRNWCVITPYGIRWRPKFSSSEKAWRRIANYDVRRGEPLEVCIRRLKNLGWKVVCDGPEQLTTKNAVAS